MWRTESDYECFHELQSGKGYADVIYAPKRNDSLPILLIEFKHDTSAEDAMDQIKKTGNISADTGTAVIRTT